MTLADTPGAHLHPFRPYYCGAGYLDFHLWTLLPSLFLGFSLGLMSSLLRCTAIQKYQRVTAPGSSHRSNDWRSCINALALSLRWCTLKDRFKVQNSEVPSSKFPVNKLQSPTMTLDTTLFIDYCFLFLYHSTNGVSLVNFPNKWLVLNLSFHAHCFLKNQAKTIVLGIFCSSF